MRLSIHSPEKHKNVAYVWLNSCQILAEIHQAVGRLRINEDDSLDRTIPFFDEAEEDKEQKIRQSIVLMGVVGWSISSRVYEIRICF